MTSSKRVQLLVSTMKRKDISWFDKLNSSSDAIIINQCGRKGKTKITHGPNNILWIDSDDIGLSKSRNMALDNATGEYLIIADDDLEYIDGYEKIIVESFEKNPNMDIIVFQVEGIEQVFKNYSKKGKKISFLGSLHVSSVEIVMRKNSIKKANIRFAEEFGSGAKYRMGEENIFLFDCLKSGLKIYYEPKVIAKLHLNESTWFSGYNKKYFLDRGAVSRKLYGDIIGLFMILAFSVKNYKKYRNDMSVLNGLKYMIFGYREFK
ncbi:glycosyltransferase family A protein [Lachnoanaerobaculum sp.]|uniref:glycosyltransferase family A protein n=1 Tax=Lachnoanaerobaculum sp. TaxID=2049030 RepID=UPI0025C44216|nr:glycosyltransferase family A protein [Lachnoanaerobaculum sp.]